MSLNPRTKLRIILGTTLFAMLFLVVWLMQLSYAQESSFQPNLCYQSTDPNCDWHHGWLDALATQAAQNFVVASYPNAAVLYNDDDPNNDPNLCFFSTDPDCNWQSGWHDAKATLQGPVLNAGRRSRGGSAASDNSWWDPYGEYRLVDGHYVKGTASPGWLTAVANDGTPIKSCLAPPGLTPDQAFQWCQNQLGN